MNKKILTLCAIASIAVAVFSCSKKDDDKTTDTTSTTSTTATTATTSTTSTTTPTPVLPTPGSNQVAIDTLLIDYEIANCMGISQGRYALSANMVDTFNNKFTATFGKSPNFSNEFTITPDLPTINSSTQIQLTASIGPISYTAQSGKVSFFKNVDSTGVMFTKITFKGNNDSTKILSGLLKCP